MKIAVISTTIMTLPPAGYSGLEMLAYQQAEGLAKRRHKVLLVAPVGSTPPKGVELHGTTVREHEGQAYTGYGSRLKDYDVIIDNSWEKFAYIGKVERQFKAPVIGVCHAPIEGMYRRTPPMPRPCLVCISKDHAARAQELWRLEVRVAYNGVYTGFYKPKKVKRNDRYLFLARFSKIKGAHLAIDAAMRTGVGLDLVGDDKITGEPEYAAECVARATGKIKYHGGVEREKTVDFYSRAKAMLHMNQIFREPFGLAPVEAQLCGCPVIAFDNGAMRETIKVGETGFLVSKPEEVDELIKSDAVASINPKRCREWAMQFSVENMVKRYEELCKEAIEGGW